MNSRRLRATITASLSSAIIVLACSLGSSAAAASSLETGSSNERADGKSYKQVERELALLLAQGADAATVKAKLGLIVVSDPPPVSGGVTPQSSSSVISLKRPVIYYDTGAKYYYVDAGWTYTTWPADDPFGYGQQNVGGLDGFGVNFSKQVVNLGGSLTYCPASSGSGTRVFKCTTATNYWSNNAYGSSWKFQDQVRTTNIGLVEWNVYQGTLVKTFRLTGAGCLQVGTSYAHGWDSTSVTGFGVGPGSFSIQWNTSEDHWDRASALGSLGC